MFNLFSLWFGALFRLFRRRGSLVMENLVLRQQLAVLKRRHPRPMLNVFDKLFWVPVCQFWSQWKQSLIVVTPETVVRWHRAGFRLYWKLISKVTTQVGRKQTPKDVRQLILRMMAENPTWGTPPIPAGRYHSEMSIGPCTPPERELGCMLSGDSVRRRCGAREYRRI
jgi:hypothetical protein